MRVILRFVKLLSGLFFLFVGLLLYLRNDQQVTLDIYVQVFELPLSMLLVLVLILGALLGMLVSVPAMFLAGRRRKRDAGDGSHSSGSLPR